MTSRTSETAVTFLRPFLLAATGISCPPGTYRVVTEEETIEGLSFEAWRRVSTALHLRQGGTEQVVTVDPAELESLLAADRDAPPETNGTKATGRLPS